jgi:hypothetical protein
VEFKRQAVEQAKYASCMPVIDKHHPACAELLIQIHQQINSALNQAHCRLAAATSSS